jgi:drug/metabolite transporter (DMT)-like permease
MLHTNSMAGNSLRRCRIVPMIALSCVVPISAFHFPHLHHQRSHTVRSTRGLLSFHEIRYSQVVSTLSYLKLTPLDSPSNENLSSITRKQQLSDKNKGLLVLFTVPLAWGTFEPAVRLVYQYQPDIPPFVFSLAYYLAASIVLGLLSYRSTAELDVNMEVDSAKSLLTTDDGRRTPVLGGIELGTYLFIGNALQIIGLKTVPSDRAAFLLQLTTIFVPLVQSVLARDIAIIPSNTWMAALVALSGVGLIGLDGSNASVPSSLGTVSLENLGFSMGDFYIMLGALFYTFHCIRLELYARKTSAIRLAAAKATTEAAWSAVVLVVCISLSALLPLDYKMSMLDPARDSGDNIISYLRNLDHQEGDPHWLNVGIATLWTGLVTVAYTIYAQSFGQSRVPAATANLIYTIQPFFTALVAFLVLGERLGPYGYVGGSLIGAAVFLVVADDKQDNSTLGNQDQDDTALI